MKVDRCHLKFLPRPATWQEMSSPFIHRKYESLPDLFVTGQLGINCDPELNEFQPREFSIDLPSFSAESRCYLRHQFPRYLLIITNFNVKTWSPMCVAIFQRRFLTGFSRMLEFFFFKIIECMRIYY